MEDVKNKNIYELLEDIDNKLYYLSRHNKNYNKEQYNNILELIDIVDELRERIV